MISFLCLPQDVLGETHVLCGMLYYILSHLQQLWTVKHFLKDWRFKRDNLHWAFFWREELFYPEHLINIMLHLRIVDCCNIDNEILKFQSFVCILSYNKPRLRKNFTHLTYTFQCEGGHLIHFKFCSLDFKVELV